MAVMGVFAAMIGLVEKHPENDPLFWLCVSLALLGLVISVVAGAIGFVMFLVQRRRKTEEGEDTTSTTPEVIPKPPEVPPRPVEAREPIGKGQMPKVPPPEMQRDPAEPIRPIGPPSTGNQKEGDLR